MLAGPLDCRLLAHCGADRGLVDPHRSGSNNPHCLVSRPGSLGILPRIRSRPAGEEIVASPTPWGIPGRLHMPSPTVSESDRLPEFPDAIVPLVISSQLHNFSLKWAPFKIEPLKKTTSKHVNHAVRFPILYRTFENLTLVLNTKSSDNSLIQHMLLFLIQLCRSIRQRCFYESVLMTFPFMRTFY